MNNTTKDKDILKYKFVSYFKYRFVLKLEDGTLIENEDQNSDDIYRLGIEVTGYAFKLKSEDEYLIDGVLFVKQ